MKLPHMLLTVALAAVPSAAVAQDTHQMTQSAPGSAEVAQCMQAQAVVTPALESARTQLEMARQTNSPAAMRAALDALDVLLLSVRTRLEPCGQLSAAAPSPMAGHAMPSTSPDPAAMPAGQNMANMPGHNMANMPVPATQNPAAAPAGQNMANMPGHNMANMPAPATQKPAAAPQRGAGRATPNQASAPAGQNMANMPGHNMANMPAPATQKPTAGPQGGTAPATPSQAAAPAGHSMANMPSSQSAAATPPDMVEDPVSKTQVDSRSALRVRYQGRMYYFRSDKERQEFLKNPAKYVSGK